MKKLLSFAAAAALALALEPLSIGVNYPSADVIEVIRDDLAKAGYELKIIEFSDYVLPNEALAAGELDLNQFQTVAYLDDFNAKRGTDLVAVGNVFLVPMGVYSNKVKSLSDLEQKALIYIPNDPSNETRALDLLESAGLIELDHSKEHRTVLDIVKNPKNLRIFELDAAQLPRVLDESDAAVINTNYALLAGLNPVKDAIFKEGKNPYYNNVIVARKEDANSAKTQAYVKAFQTQKVKDAIKRVFKDSVIPVFDPIK